MWLFNVHCDTRKFLMGHQMVKFTHLKFVSRVWLTLLHSARPKLLTILAFLSAVGLCTNKRTTKFTSANSKRYASKSYHIEY